MDDTAATPVLPAAPALPGGSFTAAILGYTDLPETSRGLNNSKGFAIGLQGAAYNVRGRREPSVTVNIRPGNVAALAKLFPDPTTGILPYLCISVLVKGGYTDVYRFCKPSSVAFNFSGGDGQGGELTIAVTFQAIAHVFVAEAPTFPPASDIRDLGTPLVWSDVRTFTINGTYQLRKALMSASATLDIGLERKNQRPNWGDDKPLSNTTYALLEHHKTVTGEIGLHERVDKDLFTGSARAQNWGNIVIACSNLPAGGGESFNLTLSGCLPTNESMQGGESSKEIDFTIPFAADDIAFTFVDQEED